LVHSRCWKFQLPYFARNFRVLTFDGRGNGRSDRPLDPAAYAEAEYAADALAVLDATDTDRAAIVGFSLSGQRGVMLSGDHGDRDRQVPHARGAALAEATGGTLVTLEGSGHAPHLRDPVKVNLLLRDFLGEGERPKKRQLMRSMRRRHPRALYVSSPIGLGHAQRDLAIARELRTLHPDLEIVWLAQHPVTRVLEAAGETVHPASKLMANESAHIESEMGEHDLHVFQAWREMDEILLANFMLFHDVVRDDHYDLWLGDESWELDYYLHENPELKAAPYVFMTDFVGWLPIDDAAGSREAFVAADYNHDCRHVERYP